MAHHGSVTRLIGELRSHDPAVRDVAARLIWQRYFHALLELARSNLDKRIRRRTDEEDVAQSMFKSFCLRQQKGEFDLAGRDDLWKLLVTITLRKARNAANAHRRRKRDVAREQTVAGNGNSASVDFVLEEMDAAAPTPAEAMVLNEALECHSRRCTILSCARSRYCGSKVTPIAKSPTGSIAPNDRSSES